jgi:hypothetical protein
MATITSMAIRTLAALIRREFSASSGSARTLIALASVCSCLATANAQVTIRENINATNDIVARFGAGHSDNLLRSRTQPLSGSYTALGLLVDYARLSTRMTATVTSDLEFRNYTTSGIKDEPYGNLAARVDLFAVPDRFAWVFTEDFGQGRLDPLSAIGPNNQEQINFASTGPALFLPVGDRNEIRLSSIAGRRTYQESVGFDNDTLESAFGVFRQLSSTTEIGLNFVRRDIEFNDSQFEKNIDLAYFSYSKTLANGQASLGVGTNGVDSVSSSESYPFFTINWARDLTSRTTLTLAAQNRLVDPSENFRGGQNAQNDLRTRDVYERSNGQVAIQMTLGRSQISLAGSLGKDRYESEVALDNDVTQVNFTLDRQISPRLNFGADVILTERDFQTVDQRDDDLRVGAFFERLFGRKLSLNIRYEHLQRDGRNAARYDENVIRAMLQYGLNSRANGA